MDLYQESLQISYHDTLDTSDIFIESSDPNIHNDEDSGNKDDGGVVDKVVRQQLRAQAEILINILLSMMTIIY